MKVIDMRLRGIAELGKAAVSKSKNGHGAATMCHLAKLETDSLVAYIRFSMVYLLDEDPSFMVLHTENNYKVYCKRGMNVRLLECAYAKSCTLVETTSFCSEAPATGAEDCLARFRRFVACGEHNCDRGASCGNQFRFGSDGLPCTLYASLGLQESIIKRSYASVYVLHDVAHLHRICVLCGETKSGVRVEIRDPSFGFRFPDGCAISTEKVANIASMVLFSSNKEKSNCVRWPVRLPSGKFVVALFASKDIAAGTELVCSVAPSMLSNF